MKAEFDYQWKNLPSPLTEYTEQRVHEFLKFTGLYRGFLKGKKALDAGCGNGRYTFAMQWLGAHVTSIDVSPEAVKQCKENVNLETKQMSIFDLEGGEYDFILCWGVLHHTPDPRLGFGILKSNLCKGGTLHLMLYHNKTQKRYRKHRDTFKTLDEEGKLELCRKLAKKPEDIHGWYDALNPEFNHSYETEEIVKWYKDTGFKNIKVMNTSNININGQL